MTHDNQTLLDEVENGAKMANKVEKKWTEGELLDFLENTYRLNDGWCCLRQVRNKAGHDATRSADGLMIGLWPSRGHELTGFEVKVSRGDFLHELKHPKKAEAIAQHCDFWYIIAPPGMIRKDELPDNWGLMTPVQTKLRITKRAKKIGEAKPLPRSFVAAMMKRFVERIQKDFDPRKEREAGHAEGYKDGYARGIHEAGDVSLHDRMRLNEFKEAEKKFLEITGISFWSPQELEHIGEAIKFIMSAQRQIGWFEQIHDEAQSLRNMAAKLDRMVNLLQKPD